VYPAAFFVVVVVVDGTQVQIVDFDDAKVASDVGEVFVAGDQPGGLYLGGVDVGASARSTWMPSVATSAAIWSSRRWMSGLVTVIW
jgi:hypothetical protein